MPRYVSKTNPDIVINVGDDDALPGGVDAWDVEGSTPRRRRRADTGTVPTQRPNSGH